MSETIEIGSESETERLQQEYEAAPQVHAEIVRFYGKYIDEIEAFDKQLDDFWEEDNEHFRRQRFYRKMETDIYDIEKIPIGMPLHILGSTALAAASKALHEAKSSYVEQREMLNESGEILSRAFVSHMRTRASGYTQTGLNGTVYEWDDAVITTRFKEQEHGKTLVIAFCARELSKQYFEKYLIQGSIQGAAIGPKQVAPRDWQQFMDKLRTVALFNPTLPEEDEA